MPIPLLFIGAAAVAGAVGVGKGIKAGIDQSEANDTNRAAERKINRAKEKVENYRSNCGKAIEELGKRKLEILNSSIKTFVEEFGKIDNIELSESTGLNEFLDKKSFSELRELQGIASSIAGGVASGAMAGAITAFGAYGAAGALATASTGAAIASLSGAAATNATLAFFGGGSLAAGGLGMAGGTMVLGGLVAGPALAIMGFVVGAKASKNLDNAYSNLAEARKFEEEMNAAADACVGIRRRAVMFDRFLIRLHTVFDPLVYEMTQIIKSRGTEYRQYTDKERKVIASAMSIAGAIKSVLDTAILDKDGNLTEESELTVSKIGNKVKGKL